MRNLARTDCKDRLLHKISILAWIVKFSAADGDVDPRYNSLSLSRSLAVIENHMRQERSESARERRKAMYKSDPPPLSRGVPNMSHDIR